MRNVRGNDRHRGIKRKSFLRHRWRDGTSSLIFDPVDLVGKLAALVPPPRVNLVRYHGVLAPSARWRSRIVPIEPREGNDGGRRGRQGKRSQNEGQGHPGNYPWAELMKRVVGYDVLKCDACGGRMRIVCAIHPPEAIRKILDCLGLPSRPPPVSPALSADPFSF